MQINSNATKMLQNIITKLDSFPNMIASAQNRAVMRAIEVGYTKMYRYGMGASYVSFDVKTHGPLGLKITVKPDGVPGSREYIAGSVFLTGRRGGQIIRPRPGKKALKLRPQSVQEGYPEFVKEVKLKAMRGNKTKIKQDLREALIFELEDALKMVGFGPRGGAPRQAVDFATMRTRFPKRSK